ncbi:MAG: hydrogenase 3 maturation endopeptidase HyCI [Bellilinea sp.]|nr:MAG: hydrogenase 3 maturation endopeptidase HyCI [Bellilinea sp.]
MQLRSLLNRLANEAGGPLRLAVIGIGNEFNGDDAAGVLVVRTLQKQLSQSDHLLLIEGGTAPENTTGTLRRFRPHVVIMLDSAEMGQPPGSVMLVAIEDLDGLSASTHTLPPSVLSKFLQSELGCRVVLLGIQPFLLEFDAHLSAPVKKAVVNLSRALRRILESSS